MPRARTRIFRQLERRPRKMLAQLADDPRRAAIAEEFLEHVSTVLDGDPVEGSRLASIAVRLTFGLGDELQAKALGGLAMAHRARGRYETAHKTLALAFERARDAPQTLALLERRRAHLLGSEGQLDEALAKANAALELARAANDEDGVGRSHVTCAVLQGLRGDHRAAVRSAQAALTQLCPKRSQPFRRSALYVTSISVAKTGGLADVRAALAQFSAIHANLKGQYSKSITAERAKVKWVEGLLHQRLGANNRARQLLEQARKYFIKLQMPQEIAAVTADLALIVVDSRDEVREVVGPVNRLAKAKEILFPPGIVEGLQKLWDSTRTSNPWEGKATALRSDRSRLILEAIYELRKLFEDNKAIPALLLPMPPREELADASPIGF